MQLVPDTRMAAIYLNAFSRHPFVLMPYALPPRVFREVLEPVGMYRV